MLNLNHNGLNVKKGHIEANNQGIESYIVWNGSKLIISGEFFARKMGRFCEKSLTILSLIVFGFGIVFMWTFLGVSVMAAEPVEVIVEGIEGEILKNVQADLALPPGLVQEGRVDRSWLDRIFAEKSLRYLRLKYWTERKSNQAKKESSEKRLYITQLFCTSE
jgi:hypothetical protein